MSEMLERPGHDALWQCFGLSYASWLTLPRVLMHEMPDDWQQRMAELIHEFDEAWKCEEMPTPHVVAKENGRHTRWPGWLLDYRHPDFARINDMRSNAEGKPTPD